MRGPLATPLQTPPLSNKKQTKTTGQQVIFLFLYVEIFGKSDGVSVRNTFYSFNKTKTFF